LNKQSVTQALFLIAGLTQVEHDLITINIDRFLDDGEYRLAKFYIARRASSPFNIDTELITSTLHERVSSIKLIVYFRPKSVVKYSILWEFVSFLFVYLLIYSYLCRQNDKTR
jgi:hypothetical protein